MHIERSEAKPQSPSPRLSFLDVDFTNLTTQDVINEIRCASHSKFFRYVVTPNVDHIVRLHNAEEGPVHDTFQESYAGAAITLCDSRILQFLARFAGFKLERLTGSDLTALLFEQGLFDNQKIALIGADETILAGIKTRYPRVTIAQHMPPMGVLRNAEAIAEIVKFVAQTKAQYTLFAFGSPQSEIVALRCLQSSDCVGIGLCIGASIEFLIGAKRRAPKWMQAIGLEWFFRLVSEPTRLWRRYLVEGPRVFAIFWRWRRAQIR